MNIPKAIEILTKMEKTLEPTMAMSGIEAMELGIEALKAQKFMREHPGMSFNYWLPGETEE